MTNYSSLNNWYQDFNTTFELCQLEENCFDAVIAATSFHWISSKIRYSKTAKILKNIGKSVIDSDKFQQTCFMEIMSKLTYKIDDYLALLSTLSPYIAMKSSIRHTLFEHIRSTLQKKHGNKIDLSYLSVLQMTKKI
ncbi:MAG: hypothetical protein QNJ42_14050 [Crocosphaera sp.]|nr:hypothetical protein [Crocosphaera sp.]